MTEVSVGGRIYRGGKATPGILHIDTESGLITKLARTKALPDHTDFGDRLIVPGAIDVHVHLRDPGGTHKEDFHTGTVAAAHGGVTTVVDMPNTLPPTTNPKAVAAKHELAAAKAVVDYGFWAGSTWYTDGLPETLRGCVGVKLYLGASTGDLLLEEHTALKKIMAHAAAAGKPVALHAEAERVLQGLRRTESNLADHAATRPPLSEVEAVYDVMKILKGMKRLPKVHVAHVASIEALQAAEQAGFGRGVCPHHLLLSFEDFQDAPEEGYGKMNPPLRDGRARQALHKAFADGRIPILESDHAPHTRIEKEGVFHQVPAGVPGVETLLPVMLAEAKAGRLPLATVLDAATKAPAGLLGLEDRGVLRAGRRADLAVYDLDDVQALTADMLHSKCGWTPYEGRPVILPTHTYLRGVPVVEDGALVARPGTGKSIVPWP